jgi:threonine dehydratase
MIEQAEIESASRMIAGQILKTPLTYSPTLSRMFGEDIYLKLENLQRTGSFKIRGAMYKLLLHIDKIGPKGVVAASAGNHAQGVALAARQANLPATIVMPEWVSISKQQATRNYGGHVIIQGQTVGESLTHAQELAQDGRTFIHPYDDRDIICGQGTIGLEILRDLPDIDMIVVPIGGGGLVSGIAAAAKALKPDIKIIGVQAAACPSAFKALQRRRSHRVQARASIADGIAVRQTGELTFAMMMRLVDDVVLVEEEHIAAAILLLLERKKTLAEGAGAVPLAALLKGVIALPRGGKVVLVISGGNVDSPLLGRIINQGLLKNSRIMRISVFLDDTPGSLSRLLGRVAHLKANVLNIFHDRNVLDIPINVTRVNLELETRGPEHVKAVLEDLKASGYALE